MPSALAHPSSPTPGPPEPGLPQAFFCGRSDYFRALLDDHFQENEELEVSGGLPAITLHGISPEVFTHVLYYIYSDHTEVGPQVVPAQGLMEGPLPPAGPGSGVKRPQNRISP